MEKYALKEVAVRLKLEDIGQLFSEVRISSPTEAVQVLMPFMQGLDREEVVVANLDTLNRPINYHVVCVGDIDRSLVPVQNVFKTALLSNASKIMVLHNHPSGSLKPSLEDEKITQQIIAAGRLMNIEVLDHIIVAAGEQEYYSFRNSSNLFERDYSLLTLLHNFREEEEVYECEDCFQENKKHHQYLKM